MISLGQSAEALLERDGTHDRAAPRPPIDRAHLARYTLGDRALEAEILDLFAGQAPQTLARLAAAQTEREWREAAHTIKGSARAVGAFPLADAAAAIERTDVWRTSPDKAAAVHRLTCELAEATAFIEALKISA
jgi:HPt (histidine-containing phosphotransfer) domain-containing protein